MAFQQLQALLGVSVEYIYLFTKLHSLATEFVAVPLGHNHNRRRAIDWTRGKP